LTADTINGAKRPLVKLQPETGEPLPHARVEDLAVLLRRIVVERSRVRVAKRDELLAARVHEIDEVAVALLRLIALGVGVGPERGLAIPDEAGVLALEEVELALDDVGEPAAAAKAEQDGRRLLRLLRLLVRTWNLFHGRTSPPSRRLYLEQMVRRVTGDAPDLVALQEVTPWALDHLERWSGMTGVEVVTKRGFPGPLARLFHLLAPVHVRSGLTGQANAVLLNPRFRLAQPVRAMVLNPGSPRERRICQLLQIVAGDHRFTLANFHATAHEREIARAEIKRVAELVGDASPCIVCGDFNVPGGAMPGFSRSIPGLDQILVRGLAFERPPTTWPKERRLADGRLLSDHAPVEAVITST
jgi:endonuclease/exonuclease/phosphatase family metal-dependent hydrolase